MAYQLKALPREKGAKSLLSVIRKNYKIPAVVYGHGTESQNLTLDYHEFQKLYEAAGTSSLIDLSIDKAKKTIPVLISEIQKHPVSNRYSHIDLLAVRMDEKIRTNIELKFIGESPAVKNLGANLLIAKESLYVECLPKDLVSSIAIDISVLQEIDDSIHLRDLEIPEGITVLDDPNSSIASALAKQAEEVITVAEEVPVVEGEVPAGEQPEGAAPTAASETPAKKEEKK